MASALLWDGAFGEVRAPLSPARERAVRHLDSYAELLAEPNELDAYRVGLIVGLLSGQGSIAPFWEELNSDLRTDMQTAAECLDLLEHGAETVAAILMDLAAGVIEEGGR